MKSGCRARACLPAIHTVSASMHCYHWAPQSWFQGHASPRNHESVVLAYLLPTIASHLRPYDLETCTFTLTPRPSRSQRKLITRSPHIFLTRRHRYRITYDLTNYVHPRVGTDTALVLRGPMRAFIGSRCTRGCTDLDLCIARYRMEPRRSLRFTRLVVLAEHQFRLAYHDLDVDEKWVDL